MEPAPAVLPELPDLGHEAEAAPPVGPRNVPTLELALELGHALLELVPALDRPALPGRVRADLCAARPRREVRVGLRIRHSPDGALDPNFGLGPAGLGTLYLAVIITALAYLVWNWALERVAAPRAAISLTVQPITGTLLGVLLLGDAFTVFTAAGGVLIVAGLALTARP